MSLSSRLGRRRKSWAKQLNTGDEYKVERNRVFLLFVPNIGHFGRQVAEFPRNLPSAKQLILPMPPLSREDIRLPEKGDANSHGARPVY